MSYSYSPTHFPCSKCKQHKQVNDITQVESKVFVTYTDDVDEEGRKAFRELSVQAWQRLSKGCYVYFQTDLIKGI